VGDPAVGLLHGGWDCPVRVLTHRGSRAPATSRTVATRVISDALGRGARRRRAARSGVSRVSTCLSSSNAGGCRRSRGRLSYWSWRQAVVRWHGWCAPPGARLAAAALHLIRRLSAGDI